MALYSPPTGVRIEYDRDGSIGWMQAISGSAPASGALSTGVLQAMNDDSASEALTFASSPFNCYFGVYFPVFMDLTHYFLSHGNNFNGSQANSLEISSDTTTGSDGTWRGWTPGAPVSTSYGSFTPNYRSPIPLAVSGVKAVRMNWSGGYASWNQSFCGMHLYGTPSVLNDRLEFWHPTNDESLNLYPGWLDWSDTPRGSAARTRQFRIKNMSSAKTANATVMSIEALTDTSPTIVGMHTLALGAGSFATTQTLPNLAPGAISGLITVQDALTASAALGLATQRIVATPGSWT